MSAKGHYFWKITKCVRNSLQVKSHQSVINETALRSALKNKVIDRKQLVT